MHIRNRRATWNQALQASLAGLLAVVLVGFVTGCGGAGSNEDGGDGDGDGDGSGIEAPAAPSGLEGTSGDGEVSLSWNAVGEADSYNVYRSTNPTDGAEGNPLESGVGSASYTDTEASNGTTYYYRVTAVNAEGDDEAESDASGEVEVTPTATPIAPAAPSGLESTSGDGEVSLSWNAVGEADSYNVYRSTDPTDGAEGNPLESGIESSSYTDTEATNETTYYYRVTAVNAGSASESESGASGEVQATPLATPAAPSGLEAMSGDGEVSLDWEAVDEADSYNVYRSTESTSGAEGDPLESGVEPSSYTDTEASNGTKYYYRVTAVNTAGNSRAESDPSSEVERTPFSDPPDEP